MPDPMAQILSLYIKQFLKNQNLRRQVVQNEDKDYQKWNGTYAAVFLVSHSILHYIQNPMSKPSCQRSRKTIITQKVLVTQSSNLVHCDWHTQKSICAEDQAFSNTFSLLKLTFFFIFFVRGS